MHRPTVVVSLALTVAIVVLLYQRTRIVYRSDYLLPVRVHLLRGGSVPAVNCQLTEVDIRRIFSKVAAIWRQARIQIVIDSIVEEEAGNQESVDATSDTVPFSALQQLRPSASLSERMIHVYYVHKMPSNGVCQGLGAIFVQDTAVLRPVEGGIDEPLPRVTAHELGHAFGLPHREAVTNLMASGTTGAALNDDEIMVARATVAAFPFSRRVD